MKAAAAVHSKSIHLTRPEKTSLPSLLAKRDELKALIAEADAIVKTIDEELLIKVSKTEEKKIMVGKRSIQLIERLSFSKVPLEFAKKFRAVKKVVDGDVLRPLYKKGVAIPDVTTTQYVLVK